MIASSNIRACLTAQDGPANRRFTDRLIQRVSKWKECACFFLRFRQAKNSTVVMDNEGNHQTERPSVATSVRLLKNREVINQKKAR
jgi:hypothetical protein